MRQRLLIVGAGIGGLTLLCALRSRELGSEGWLVELAERAPELAPAGVGIVLHPNGLQVLAQLGLADEVIARGSVLRDLEIVRAGESRTLRLAEVWAGARQPTVAIARSELHELLAHAAPALPGEGREVVSVRSGERSAIVVFADGSTAEYDLVVGADGVHSTVRSSTDPAAAAVSTGHFYLRFAAPNLLALPEDTWRTTELEGAAHGCIPLSRGHLHCFLQLHAPDEPPADEEALAAACARIDGDLARLFAARTGPPHTGFGFVVRPVSWGSGATVLVGDAAHAVSPTLSEGGSLALEDALVLALALRQGPTVAGSLARFRAARHERVVWAQRMSLSQGRSGRAPAWTGDAVAATRHLRDMYAPLRVDPAALLADPA